MSTETEIVEVKEEKNASPDNALAENQYKIFDYFKEHTGLLVTCISALVAIMSFILHFAVGRMNYASCLSGKGIITLNKWLLEAPRNCIEYVMMHEFCHFIHPNHSNYFLISWPC